MNALVKSASRVLDILDLFTLDESPLGVTEVARRLAIPKSSAHALLATLESRGYLVRSGALFTIAPELRFGNGHVEGPLARLIQIAGPVMQAIADKSGESAFLAVATPDRRWIKYVAKAVSSNELRYDASLTNLRPLHASSSGLVVMAHRPLPEQEEFLQHAELKAITRRTITDREELKRVFAKARREGIAESGDANVAGASGVSAPVLGRDGFAMAAVALVAPSWRYKESRGVMREQVSAGAAELMRGMRGQAAAKQASQAGTRHAGGVTPPVPAS